MIVTLLYVLNVICSSGQSALSKQYSRIGGDSSVFNINRAASGMVLFLIFGIFSTFIFNIPTIIYGACYGIMLCISMHSGFKALSIGPMALTSIIASFSLIIPFIFGIIFWNEHLNEFKIIGIILLLISIFLINIKKEKGFSKKWLFYALLTLVANGICSIIQKLHQIKYPSMYKTEFMFWALLCVFIIISITSIIKKNEKTKFKFSLLGTLAGIANCLANYIVLYLSATENASVLFPITSIAKIFAVWLIGVLFFKEKIRSVQAFGLIIGVISVVLLKI